MIQTTSPADAVALLCAKQEIRELALLYSRGVDRKDYALLRNLYTRDGWDDHGAFYKGGKEGYIDALEAALASYEIGAHYICNHLITVSGDEGEGEVYCFAYHLRHGEPGVCVDGFLGVRYLDRYRKEDGCWRFVSRTVAFDWRREQTIAREHAEIPEPASDASYATFSSPAFRRGARNPSA